MVVGHTHFSWALAVPWAVAVVVAGVPYPCLVWAGPGPLDPVASFVQPLKGSQDPLAKEVAGLMETVALLPTEHSCRGASASLATCGVGLPTLVCQKKEE